MTRLEHIQACGNAGVLLSSCCAYCSAKLDGIPALRALCPIATEEQTNNVISSAQHVSS